jgi:hypothetical protein
LVPDNALWQYEYASTPLSVTPVNGNVRAVFAVTQQGTAELRQKTDYYPFGMVMSQNNEYCRSSPENKFLYNEQMVAKRTSRPNRENCKTM